MMHKMKQHFHTHSSGKILTAIVSYSQCFHWYKWAPLLTAFTRMPVDNLLQTVQVTVVVSFT